MTLVLGSAGRLAVAMACFMVGGGFAQQTPEEVKAPADRVEADKAPAGEAPAGEVAVDGDATGAPVAGAESQGTGPTAPAEPAADPAPGASWAKVAATEVALRCFQTAHSPTWPEKLRQGDVVRVTGATEGGFVPVELPLGVLGFVHARFVEIGDAGVVTPTADRVAFRCSTEAGTVPIEILTKDDVLRLVGKDGDWLRVRRPGRSVWLAEADVTLFGDGTEVPTLAAGWEDLGVRQEAEAATAATAIAEERAAAVKAAELEKQAKALRARVEAESSQPEGSQQWAALSEEGAALLVEIGDGPGQADASWAQRTADTNRRRIELAAFAASTDHPDPKLPDAPPPPELDPMREFVIGWVRHRKPLFGESRVEIEKGGQVLFELICESGRYDLAGFDGLEVAVRGVAERGMIGRGQPKEHRTLDVVRLEILACPVH